jgi:hypothetical protein
MVIAEDVGPGRVVDAAKLKQVVLDKARSGHRYFQLTGIVQSFRIRCDASAAR